MALQRRNLKSQSCDSCESELVLDSGQGYLLIAANSQWLIAKMQGVKMVERQTANTQLSEEYVWMEKYWEAEMGDLVRVRAWEGDVVLY